MNVVQTGAILRLVRVRVADEQFVVVMVMSISAETDEGRIGRIVNQCIVPIVVFLNRRLSSFPLLRCRVEGREQVFIQVVRQ